MSDQKLLTCDCPWYKKFEWKMIKFCLCVHSVRVHLFKPTALACSMWLYWTSGLTWPGRVVDADMGYMLKIKHAPSYCYLTHTSLQSPTHLTMTGCLCVTSNRRFMLWVWKHISLGNVCRGNEVRAFVYRKWVCMPSKQPATAKQSELQHLMQQKNSQHGWPWVRTGSAHLRGDSKSRFNSLSTINILTLIRMAVQQHGVRTYST